MLIHPDKIASFCATLREAGATVVFTNGCFDILHAGHVRYLEQAKSYGDILVLGLNTDASVRENKGPRRPINSERDRAEVVGALRAVDYVVLTAGSYDLLAEVVCENDDDLIELLNNRIRRIEGVQSTETFVYLKLHKQLYNWGTR